MLFYRIHVLLFGARESVFQIKMVASGIKQLTVRGVLLPGLSCYDGFSPIIPRIMSKAEDLAVKEGCGRPHGVEVGGREDSQVFKAVGLL